MSQVVPLRSIPSAAPVAAPERPVLGDILVRNGRVAPAALALSVATPIMTPISADQAITCLPPAGRRCRQT